MIDIIKFIIDTIIDYINIFLNIKFIENISLGYFIITILVIVLLIKFVFLRMKGD